MKVAIMTGLFTKRNMEVNPTHLFDFIGVLSDKKAFQPEYCFCCCAFPELKKWQTAAARPSVESKFWAIL